MRFRHITIEQLNYFFAQTETFLRPRPIRYSETEPPDRAFVYVIVVVHTAWCFLKCSKRALSCCVVAVTPTRPGLNEFTCWRRSRDYSSLPTMKNANNHLFAKHFSRLLVDLDGGRRR